jgi:hypothetical protein
MKSSPEPPAAFPKFQRFHFAPADQKSKDGAKSLILLILMASGEGTAGVVVFDDIPTDPQDITHLENR